METCLPVHTKLEEFRREARYSDVTILADGRTFKCHRVILAAVSGYFDAMLDGRFVESGVRELMVHEIDSESFEAVLLYAYTGCRPAFDGRNILSLLRTTQFLQVQNIQKLCIQYILTNMYAVANVLEILMFASATNIVPLIGPLREHIVANYFSLSQCNEFLKMPLDDLWKVVNLVIERHSSPVLQNDDLFADSLVRWLKYNYENRKDHIKTFSSVMRLKNISPEYVEFVDRHYGMQLCLPSEEWLWPKCGTLFDSFSLSNENPIVLSYGEYQFSKSESLSLHLFTRNAIFSVNRFKPDGFLVCNEDYDIRNLDSVVSDESSYLYCLKSTDCTSQTFYAYPSINMSASTSRILCPPPFCLDAGCSCVFQKQRNCIIYHDSSAFYCFKKNELSYQYKDHSQFSGNENFFCYNVEINKWFPVPQSGYKNSDVFVSLAVHDNLVYVFGYDQVQAYDYRSPQWLKLPRRQSSSYYVSSCSLNGKIYVDGGFCIEAFDPVAAKWEWTCEKANVFEQVGLRKCYSPKIVAYEKLLWSFLTLNLDDDESLCISIYNPETGQWHSPPVAVDSAKSFVKDGKAIFLKFITVFKSH